MGEDWPVREDTPEVHVDWDSPEPQMIFGTRMIWCGPEKPPVGGRHAIPGRDLWRDPLGILHQIEQADETDPEAAK